MSRPYLNCSIEDLEHRFAEHRGDMAVLQLLLEELPHRTTKRARRLMAQVAAALAEHSPEDDEPHEAEAPPPPEPPRATARRSHPQAEPRSLFGDAAQDFEQPPDDRRRPDRLTRMRPPGVKGVPDPWVRPLGQDLKLEVTADADLPDLYAAALNQLILEIRRTGSGQKRYELEKGARVDSGGQGTIYRFPFTDEADLFADARVDVEIPGRKVKGTIVSIGDGSLLLALDEDLGDLLPKAVLVVDATALLEALKDRVEQVKKGEVSLNRAIADAVVGRTSPPALPEPIPVPAPPAGLNARQQAAYRRALSDSVTYVWGPPGCGKTRTLAPVIEAAFAAGKRVLVCSNTNKAVDQVLLAICRELTKAHPAMQAGQVVRLGRIADDKLAEWEPYVGVEGIAKRLSEELTRRRAEVEEAIDRVDRQTRNARDLLERFAELDAAERAVAAAQERTNATARKGQGLKASLAEAEAAFARFEEELQERRKGLLGLFKRSEDAIWRDIDETQLRIVRIKEDVAHAALAYGSARDAFAAAQRRRDALVGRLVGKDRAAAEKAVREADDEREPLVAELRDIDAKLAETRATVVKNARIIGATCTKAYLSVKDIGQADLVVVDEASMVSLPAVWFCTGMAKERAVVCGDFRQIPSIVPTDQQAIFDVLGPDVFTAAGLSDPQAAGSRLVMLDEQHRMDDAICRLVSRPMYGGLLRTAGGRQRPDHAAPPAPFDGPLVIVDTSDLWPFESTNAFHSRFNLMHALLVRNLAWHFDRSSYLRHGASLGVCTPYAAQNKLIGQLLAGQGLDRVQVGTVHSFQGDERNAVILEIPESHGAKWGLGQFVQGVAPDHLGAKLINVAVSRAQNHLIVLANLTHLDKKLPSSALLRGILHQMQTEGRIVPGGEVLALRPIDRDLEGLLGRVELDADAAALGLFNQSTFAPAFRQDVQAARDSVVVFSGFVTPRRVAALGDLFRTKVSQGVKVRCVTRPPHLNGTMDHALGREALDMLDGIGCAVDCRNRIHEKIIVIDKTIVWHGSLNALSHTHRTDESMTRIVNPGFARMVAFNMSKRPQGPDRALATIADPENPRCEACGSRTVLEDGKYGPFVYCETQCGWRMDLRRATGRR